MCNCLLLVLGHVQIDNKNVNAFDGLRGYFTIDLSIYIPIYQYFILFSFYTRHPILRVRVQQKHPHSRYHILTHIPCSMYAFKELLLSQLVRRQLTHSLNLLSTHRECVGISAHQKS